MTHELRLLLPLLLLVVVACPLALAAGLLVDHARQLDVGHLVLIEQVIFVFIELECLVVFRAKLCSQGEGRSQQGRHKRKRYVAGTYLHRP